MTQPQTITDLTPSITLLPGEIFATLDGNGQPRYWLVTDTGLVKLQPATVARD